MNSLKTRILALYDEPEIKSSQVIFPQSLTPVVFTDDLIRSIQIAKPIDKDFKIGEEFRLMPTITAYMAQMNLRSSDYWSDDGQPLEPRELTYDECGVVKALAPEWYKETMKQPQAMAEERVFKKLGILALLYESKDFRIIYSGRSKECECLFQFDATVDDFKHTFGTTLADSVVMCL